MTPEDLDDDQGIRVPKINSQGKVKVFKCKQCEFVAVTKEDFWRHTKIHIKPEKMLTCPKCPFVTEYKHHLEYHLRNHFGAKPFKCPNCSYTCVNKSMLNSHMKSHTNIYQYRCQDCNYATKVRIYRVVESNLIFTYMFFTVLPLVEVTSQKIQP